MKGTGAEILAKYLENEGVRYVFGLPGGHLLTFYDALRQSSITPILAKRTSATGNSKTRPKTKRNLMLKVRYSLILGIGLMKSVA